MLMAEYAPLYANFFNISSLKEIIYQRYPKYITTVLEKSGFWNYYNDDVTFNNLFDMTYRILLNSYRCEYTYKNELLINEIIKKNHSKRVNIFSEIAINSSKADMLVANGTLTIYEMKTEIDTFSRLVKQLDDYTKTVDKVYVVTSEKKLKSLLTQLDNFEKVGIMVVSDDGEMVITEYRKALSNIDTLSQEHIFNTMNESEISGLFQGLTYYEAKSTFLGMQPSQCHELLKCCLINRKSYESEFILRLSNPLKVAGFGVSRLNRKERNCFLNKINNNILR
jgi:hypothetical protein